ncbi:MAG TPA: hypothetical protein VM285_13880 [Polyangia bacterium]|nr:hypothetical protein [Polyangia bacterium]
MRIIALIVPAALLAAGLPSAGRSQHGAGVDESEPGSFRPPPVDEVYPAPIEWRGLRVLHIGDSHVSRGLTEGLRDHLLRAGARYEAVTWVGSRSRSWVQSGKLRRLLRERSPGAVIVTLGTNAIRHPKPRHLQYWDRALVEQIGPRLCFWLGPPSLIEDRHGLNPALMESTTPCRYFETRLLDFPPREDGRFHLTRAQGLSWAAATWVWINGGPAPRSGDAL